MNSALAPRAFHVYLLEGKAHGANPQNVSGKQLDMKGNCALLGIESDLRQSHIIPKFAFDYFKETGGKYFRSFEKPNLRLQDGPKPYLLSHQAEQEFSKREGWFASNIFYPYLGKDKTSFNYDENLAYFTISILWRVLYEQMTHKDISSVKEFEFLKEVEIEWRNFLRSSVYPRTYNDLNLFFTDRLSYHNTDSIDVDLYMSRIIDATIIANEQKDTIAIYVKFLRFIFWSVVKGVPNSSSDVKISFTPNTIKVPQFLKDDFIGNFLMNRIKVVDNRQRPSPKQQEIIIQELERNENSFWESDAGQSMLNDFIHKH
ncbi:MAG: hypothetical protein RL007_408 [Bacteroidota bacterium]|jgi:hypothetical protein